ncbi:MAG: GNAT family N-acetyltransferase [Lachnospiraceae bacterium]|nr:GNAT family N-acetyltransferase [Lachnospiraceae bacterium]
MSTTIRHMAEKDKDSVQEMMRDFYHSPAVLSNGSEEIYRSDIENCIGENPYIEGYIFADGEEIQGYAMIAKSFSTEFGRLCVWIEDIYLKQECRGLGIGREFFTYIETKYPDTVLRLEAEKENESAVRMYEKCGYEILPYLEMKKIL